MEKTLEQLAKEQATEKDLEIERKIVETFRKIYPNASDINLEKLYQYAIVVLEQRNKYKGRPTGDIKTIEIEDTYGTHLRININN